MKYLSRDMAGLTLPEVLLATVIITVAILGVVGLFPTALQNVQYGGHMSQASSLTQAMIEMIRTEPFVTVPSYDGLDTRNELPSGLPASVLAHFTQWTNNIAPANSAGALPQGWGTVQVQDDALGLPDLKQVTITVGWQERGNQTIRFVTYVARHD
ncbi:MAG: hypothetical protein ACE5JQ_10195 [Candidatus Methylomirabilales bacterium]